MLDFLLISLGSIIGSIARLGINNIFLANMIGCFFLGFINNINAKKKFKLFFCFSLCGSMTSFSSWLLDLFLLVQRGLYFKFMIDLFLFIIIGYFLYYLGYSFSRKLFILR